MDIRRLPQPAAAIAVEGLTKRYRIVQEALTNVVKHSRPTRVGVTLCYRDEGVEVEVVDDGVPVAEGTGEPGHGAWLPAGGGA